MHQEILYGGGGFLLWGASKFIREYYFRHAQIFTSFRSVVSNKVGHKDLIGVDQSSGTIDMSNEVKVFRYLYKFIPAGLGVASLIGSVLEFKTGNPESGMGLLTFGLFHIAEVSAYLLNRR